MKEIKRTIVFFVIFFLAVVAGSSLAMLITDSMWLKNLLAILFTIVIVVAIYGLIYCVFYIREVIRRKGQKGS